MGFTIGSCTSLHCTHYTAMQSTEFHCSAPYLTASTATSLAVLLLNGPAALLFASLYCNVIRHCLPLHCDALHCTQLCTVMHFTALNSAL